MSATTVQRPASPADVVALQYANPTRMVAIPVGILLAVVVVMTAVTVAVVRAGGRAADLLGRADRIGRIQPGMDADIIAVTGDPVADVARLNQVEFVMRRGVVHKQGGQRQAFPVK